MPCVGSLLCQLKVMVDLVNALIWKFFEIIVGCSSGEVIILNANREMMCSGPCTLTIRKIWDFKLKQFKRLSAECPLCGHSFAPPTTVLATIENITKLNKLRPEQSPCIDLPDEASEEPGLIGNCPRCGERLKFNPFISDRNEMPVLDFEINNSDFDQSKKTKYSWRFWKR